MTWPFTFTYINIFEGNLVVMIFVARREAIFGIASELSGLKFL